MTSYNVRRVAHGTLNGGLVDTVVFSANYQSVRVMSRGSDYIYLTTDGSDPSFGGDDCFVLPPMSTAEVPVLVPVVPATVPSTTTTTTVKLIAATVVPYSVMVTSIRFESGSGGGSGVVATSAPPVTVDVSGKLDKPTQTLDGKPLLWDYTNAKLTDASASIVALVGPSVLAGVPATITYNTVSASWPARSTVTTDTTRRVTWIGTVASGQPPINSTYARVNDACEIPEA